MNSEVAWSYVSPIQDNTIEPDKQSITEVLEEEIRDFVWDRLPKTTTFEEADKIVEQMFKLIENTWPEDEV